LLLTDQAATPDLAERLRKELMGGTFTLSTAFQHDPDSFQVTVVDALVSNDRTGKTSNFVTREQS
jgi:phenylacetate-CoA ligase